MMNYVTGLILYKSAWRIIESFRLKGTIKDAGTGNDLEQQFQIMLRINPRKRGCHFLISDFS